MCHFCREALVEPPAPLSVRWCTSWRLVLTVTSFCEEIPFFEELRGPAVCWTGSLRPSVFVGQPRLVAPEVLLVCWRARLQAVTVGRWMLQAVSCTAACENSQKKVWQASNSAGQSVYTLQFILLRFRKYQRSGCQKNEFYLQLWMMCQLKWLTLMIFTFKTMIVTGTFFCYINPILEQHHVITALTFYLTTLISYSSDQSKICKTVHFAPKSWITKPCSLGGFPDGSFAAPRRSPGLCYDRPPKNLPQVGQEGKRTHGLKMSVEICVRCRTALVQQPCVCSPQRWWLLCAAARSPWRMWTPQRWSQTCLNTDWLLSDLLLLWPAIRDKRVFVSKVGPVRWWC